MRITKIAVRVGCTISTGNYENAKIEMEVEAALDPDEDETQAQARLWDFAKRSVRDEARAVRAKSGEQKSEPESAPDPRPKTLGDLVTPKQLWMLRSIAQEASFDAEAECQSLYNCPLEEISKRAASALIDEFKRRAAESVAPTTALPTF
jgi:hypothetical protein